MDKCKLVREKILNDVKKEIKELGIEPKLAIIKCNDDYASSVYVRNKVKTCESVGIKVTVYNLSPINSTLDDIIETINIGNRGFNATILQLPLADKFKDKEYELLNLIDSTHDIDGLIDKNILKLLQKDNTALTPCTAEAIYEIMKYEFNTDDFSGKEVCIINRSNLIGVPLSTLLRNHNATVTVAHSKTCDNINDYLEMNKFDVIVTGIGKHIIDEFYIMDTLIIDAGISRDDNNKLLRDVVRYEDNWNTYYGKVGICTTAIVASNTLKAYKLQNGIK